MRSDRPRPNKTPTPITNTGTPVLLVPAGGPRTVGAATAIAATHPVTAIANEPTTGRARTRSPTTSATAARSSMLRDPAAQSYPRGTLIHHESGTVDQRDRPAGVERLADATQVPRATPSQPELRTRPDRETPTRTGIVATGGPERKGGWNRSQGVHSATMAFGGASELPRTKASPSTLPATPFRSCVSNPRHDHRPCRESPQITYHRRSPRYQKSDVASPGPLHQSTGPRCRPHSRPASAEDPCIAGVGTLGPACASHQTTRTST